MLLFFYRVYPQTQHLTDSSDLSWLDAVQTAGALGGLAPRAHLLLLFREQRCLAINGGTVPHNDAGNVVRTLTVFKVVIRLRADVTRFTGGSHSGAENNTRAEGALSRAKKNA